MTMSTATLELRKQADRVETMAQMFAIPAEAIALAAERLLANALKERPVTKEQAEALMNARGAQTLHRLVDSAGDCATSEEVATILDASRQAVNERKKRKTILALQLPRGDLFPLWQFDDGKVRPWIPEVLRHFPSGGDALAFLLARRSDLDGHRFLDLALSGNKEAITQMIELASRSGESE